MNSVYLVMLRANARDQILVKKASLQVSSLTGHLLYKKRGRGGWNHVAYSISPVNGEPSLMMNPLFSHLTYNINGQDEKITPQITGSNWLETC